MAVAILSVMISQPGGLSSRLGALVASDRVASKLARSSAWHVPQYGLPVSPYKDAIVTTLVHVAGQAGKADAEWEDFVLQLSVQLRRLRHDAGLSQEEVAYRAGLSRFIYRQYESGESRRGTAANPALRSILAIAQVLQVPIEELLPKPIPDLRSR